MTRRVAGIMLAAAVPAAVIATWWLLTAGSRSPYWPPLSEILETFADDWLFERVSSDLLPSLSRFARGFALAVGIGVTLGVILGRSAGLRRALWPILEFTRAIPPAAIIPIAILVFGITDSEKVFVIAFGAVWPILLNTIDGVRGVEPTFHEAARAYGLRRRDKLLRVVLPAASPQIFVGLRIALAVALLLIVISEMFASTDGLGFFILDAQQAFRTREMWSGIFMLGIIAYLLNTLFVVIEHRILFWHRGWRASALGEPVQAAPARAWRRGRARNRWSSQEVESGVT